MNQDLQQHPLSAAFPSMSEADFLALTDDIKENGQREPIMLFEGMVLDGWHRYRACISLGVTPQQFKFSGDDPAGFVLSHNLHRRHLTASQRAAAVVSCAEWAPAHRANKMELGSTLSKTNAQMAVAAKVTPRTITDAKIAHKAGLSEAIKDGAMTVKEAAKVARGSAEKAKAAPAAVDPVEDFGPDADEMAIQAAAEAADQAALNKLLESDDKLATAVGEVKRLNAVVAAMQSRINGLQNEKNEAVRLAKNWQRKFNEASKGIPA